MKDDIAVVSIDTPCSPLWDRAVQNALMRFRNNLASSDEYGAILQAGGSASDFADLMSGIQAQRSKGFNAASSIRRLEPILKSLDDLSAVAALAFGADTTVTTLLWGSLRVCIALAATAADTLQNVLEMLEDISERLPRLQRYEATLKLDHAFEQSLLELYTETVCFCARAISFLRRYPHVQLRRHAWPELQGDFTRTMQTIKRMSNSVDAQAELAQMRASEEKNKEVIRCVQDVTNQPASTQGVLLRSNLPIASAIPTIGHVSLLDAVHSRLLDQAPAMLTTTAFYGTAGVGKTHLARELISRSHDSFPVVVWIKSGSQSSVQQSFEAFVDEINAFQKESDRVDRSAAGGLRWLRSTKSRWLLVFDGARDKTLLQRNWPSCGNGAIVITTRHQSIAEAFCETTHQIETLNPKDGMSLLSKCCSSFATEKREQDDGTTELLAQKFGGLPFALIQIGSYMSSRKLAFAKFLGQYDKHAARIHDKRASNIDHDETLATLWNESLEALTNDGRSLQSVLALMSTDSIPEYILHLEEDDNVVPGVFSDGLSLGDAEAELLEAALIQKLPDEILTMHPLIQGATLKNMTNSESDSSVTTLVAILNRSFPTTWDEDVGHQHRSWTLASKCLPHVLSLTQVVEEKRFPVQISNMAAFSELLLRCSWYTYEREMYSMCSKTVNAAIEVMPDKNSLAFASAVDLSGLVLLDLNQPADAMGPFRRAYDVRLHCLGNDDPFLASSLNNIAMAYMEMGDLNNAEKYHQEALDLRRKHQSDRIGNSLSNFASLKLRQGHPNEAEALLKACPSLANFTDETFLNTENPRFVGDMVLLSRIRVAQSMHGDAMRLAAKAMSFRRRVHGDKYKTLDIMLDVADLLVGNGKSASAVQLLEEVLHIAQTLEYSSGYAARANVALSKLCFASGHEKDGKLYEEKAEHLRAATVQRNACRSGSEDGFSGLTPVMLWRYEDRRLAQRRFIKVTKEYEPIVATSIGDIFELSFCYAVLVCHYCNVILRHNEK